MSTVIEGYFGAQRASDHADRVHHEPLWSKIAWTRLLEYLLQLRMREGRGAELTTERFRAFAKEHSVISPPDERAWGNVIRKAARKGLIFDTGKRVKEGSHGREVVVWGVM